MGTGGNPLITVSVAAPAIENEQRRTDMTIPIFVLLTITNSLLVEEYIFCWNINYIYHKKARVTNGATR